MYSYENSKSNIINILKSTTKIEKKCSIPNDDFFTFENGIFSWVSSIFIDIENSSNLFKTKDEKLARLIRAFTSEIICIFQDLNTYNQIGIRGDCVYSIYDIKTSEDFIKVFKIAEKLNSFMKMFNKIIINYGYKKINAGIGIGCDQNLIIKVGRTGTGINDKIWIGKAVIDASNLSSIAGRKGIKQIAISPLFYQKIIDIINKKNPNINKTTFSYKLVKNNNVYDFYHSDSSDKNFNTWINNNFK